MTAKQELSGILKKRPETVRCPICNNTQALHKVYRSPPNPQVPVFADGTFPVMCESCSGIHATGMQGVRRLTAADRAILDAHPKLQECVIDVSDAHAHRRGLWG